MFISILHMQCIYASPKKSPNQGKYFQTLSITDNFTTNAVLRRMKEGYIIHVQNVRFIVYIENMLKQDNTQYAASRILSFFSQMLIQILRGS